MLPLVLSHELVHPFKFWYDDELRNGMCSGKELYQLVEKFGADGRQKAFGLAVRLAEQGNQVSVTCMRSEYCVWISLRSARPQTQRTQLAVAA